MQKLERALERYFYNKIKIKFMSKALKMIRIYPISCEQFCFDKMIFCVFTVL